LSPRTFADQPSPKCCSIANLILTPNPVNGPSVPAMARGCGYSRLRHSSANPDDEHGMEISARKTKRPGLSLSPRTFADQPSPKCCSIANLILTPDKVNGPSVPAMARPVHELFYDIGWLDFHCSRPLVDIRARSQNPHPVAQNATRMGHPLHLIN
jgi:hypothetical protein